MKSFWYRFHAKYLQRKKLVLAGWVFNLFPGKYCWTDCVSFSFLPGRWNPFKIDNSKSCELESKDHDSEMCYCGQWHKGKCAQLLTENERQILRDKREEESKRVQTIPF